MKLKGGSKYSVSVIAIVALLIFINYEVESCHIVRIIFQNGSVLPELEKPYFTKEKYDEIIGKTKIIRMRKKYSKQKSSCTCSNFDMEEKKRPWAALLKNNDTNTQGPLVFCSATLISKTYFITSASCICNLVKELCPFKDNAKGNFVSKDLGQLQVLIPAFDENKWLEIQTIYIHKNYETTNNLHDIGLLKLKENDEIIANSVANPICFPTPSLIKANKVKTTNCWLEEKGLVCKKSPLYHYTGIRNGTTNKMCMSNGLGPHTFKRCMFDENQKTCSTSNPLTTIAEPLDCIQFEEEVKNISSIKDKYIINYDGTICINRNYTLTKHYKPYINEVNKLDKWCYTCNEGDTTDCKEWGYCSTQCDLISDSKMSTYTIVEGVAHSIQDENNCGEPQKNMCVIDAFYNGDIVKMERDSEGKFVDKEIKKFGPIRNWGDITTKFNSFDNHQCKELTGGAVWKVITVGNKNKVNAPFLTGLLGKINNDCGDNSHVTADVKHTDMQSYLKDVMDLVEDLCTMTLKKKNKKR